MTPQIQVKYEEALAALRELHSDTSGPLENNLEAVTGLLDEAYNVQECLQEDLKRKAREA